MRAGIISVGNIIRVINELDNKSTNHNYDNSSLMTNENCHYDKCMIKYNNTMFTTNALFSEYQRINIRLITEIMNTLKEYLQRGSHPRNKQLCIYPLIKMMQFVEIPRRGKVLELKL